MPEKRPLSISKDPIILSYIAGILDGEGYIGIDRQNASAKHSKRRNDFFRLNVQVKATDKRMTDFLMLHIGGYYRTENRRTVNGRMVHTWGVDSARAEQVLQTMLPYMVCKKDQAELCLNFRKSFGNKNHCHFGTPPDVIAFRQSCYEKIKAIHGVHSGKASPPQPLRQIA